MILEEIENLLDLNLEEKEELRENYFEYEEEIMELIEMYRKYNEFLAKKNRLHSLMARYNFDIYNTWMELHKNAISLSSYRAEANLRGIPMDKQFFHKMNELIDKYVLMVKFT